MDVMTLVVSALVAMAAGVRAAQHDDLPFWHRWARNATRTVLAGVYLLHALVGVVVADLAVLLDWVPFERAWINGAVYGAAAAALLRLEVTSFNTIQLSPGRLLFRTGLETAASWLERAAERGVQRRLGDLHRTSLCRVTWRVFVRHVDPGPADAASLTGAGLRQLHGTALSGAEFHDPELTEAQERLRYFCEVHIIAARDATIDLRDPPDDRAVTPTA